MTATTNSKLTKPQRRLLMKLAREEGHSHYPHRRERLPVAKLAALAYVLTERHNGSYRVVLTWAGFARAQEIQKFEEALFEGKSIHSVSVGAGPWPECLRPLPLAPWSP